MNTLDFILFVPVALGFIFGLFKGLVKELASLAAIVLGVFGARFFAPFVSDFLIHHLHFSPKTALPLAYLILFILIAIGLLWTAKLLDKIFDSLALGGLNKIFGGVFGGLKYALIVSVLLNVFNALDTRFTLIKSKTKAESVCYKPLMSLAPKLWEESKSTDAFSSGHRRVYKENK